MVLAILAVATSGSVTASADPYGGEPGGYSWIADSADHWYCFYVNLIGSARAPYHAAMQNLASQTDMYDVFTSNCGGSTDVMYLHNPDLGSGVFGMAVCVSLVPGSSTRCDAYWAATNNSEYSSWLGPGHAPLDVHINQNIRHETGHTAGLTHSTTPVSAMRSGLLPDYGGYNFVWGLYESHHVDHINAAF